jgi:hypothetical protein
MSVHCVAWMQVGRPKFGRTLHNREASRRLLSTVLPDCRWVHKGISWLNAKSPSWWAVFTGLV